MSVYMLWYICTPYSVRESSPVMVSRVAFYRPAFWKWRNIVRAIKFLSRIYDQMSLILASPLKLWTDSAVRWSLNSCFKNLDQIGRPWIHASRFENLDQIGRPWIHAFPFKNSDQIGGPLILASPLKIWTDSAVHWLSSDDPVIPSTDF